MFDIMDLDYEEVSEDDDEATYLSVEREFRKIACVSKRWSKLIDELIPERFFTPGFSPWVLSKYKNRNLEELYLHGDRASSRVIYDSLLVQFTSLVYLNLSENEMITSQCLEQMTNLRMLDLRSNPVISSECIEKLTNLTELRLEDNKLIPPSSLLNLPHLETLIISPESRAFEKFFSFAKLTNLRELHVRNYKPRNDPSFFLELVLPKLVNLRKLTLLECHSFKCGVLSSLNNLNTLAMDKYTRSNIPFSTQHQDLNLLTNLTSLHGNNFNFTDEGIKCLTNLVDLTYYSDKPNIAFTENSFKDLTSLVSLSMSDHVNLTREGVRNLTRLKSLNIRASMFDGREDREDEYKHVIQYLPNLTYFNFIKFW